MEEQKNRGFFETKKEPAGAAKPYQIHISGCQQPIQAKKYGVKRG